MMPLPTPPTSMFSLRSSVAPKDDRQQSSGGTHVALASGLRSSVAPEGNRQHTRRRQLVPPVVVAILGRPEE